VGSREIPFFKLPDINDIPIQNEFFGLYAVEVSDEFMGMTTIGAQMYIGYDGEFYLPFFQSYRFTYKLMM
jgi:hypothetical protein